ncbi:hypothetical protein [Pseudomonas sp. MONT-RG-20F-20-E-7-02]|uniref:hypothetical protein n=1 Tax=Pseudomonas sp. MONT-RG-20F-20-E-7-02 TaxID=2914979 RepID=UPI001F5A8403|nr:hypothetical protein [Pseudomonas sp. MONT-RG-20F-20-E-7-02]
MTTPVELINLALKQAGVLGVGQTATAEDTSDAFKLLNMMLAQWSVKRNVVHQIIDSGLPTTGAQTYSVGIGGDFSIARPSKLVGVYCRQLNPPSLPVDFPIELLQSMSDYGRISLKTMASMPVAAYYDPQYPLGVLHVWPVPITGYEMHILALVPLGQFATPYDDIILPAEYEEAIMYNLAGRLCSFYQIPIPQGVVQLAASALSTIRMANIQVGKMYMPDNLVSGGTYNVYSDR